MRIVRLKTRIHDRDEDWIPSSAFSFCIADGVTAAAMLNQFLMPVCCIFEQGVPLVYSLGSIRLLISYTSSYNQLIGILLTGHGQAVVNGRGLEFSKKKIQEYSRHPLGNCRIFA